MTRLSLITLSLFALAGCGSSDATNPTSGSPGTGDPGGSGLGPAGSQDFGLFKAILNAGKVPAPATLDQVGFFAEHTIGTPPTTCNDEVCLKGTYGQMGNMITGSTCSIVDIGMGTPLDPMSLPRPALDVAVVVDTGAPGLSSSNALADVRAGIGKLLDGLVAGDTVTLIAAGDTAIVLADTVPQAQVLTARNALGKLQGSGNTNLYDGLRTAVDHLGTAVPGHHRRLILVSEGKATIGVASPDRLLKVVQTFAEDGGGVTAIELGVSSDGRLLQQMADAGAGTLYFVNSSSELPPLFDKEVQYSLVPVAEKVRLRLTPGPSFDVREMFGIKGWTIDAAGASIDIPALFVAWRKTMAIGDGRRGGGGGILVELMPLKDAIPGDKQVATLQIDYALPGGGGTRSSMVSITSPNGPEGAPPSGYFEEPAVEKGFVVLNLYVAFRMASERATAGDYRGAWDVLNAVNVNATRWQATHPDAEIRDDLTYVQKFLAIAVTNGALAQPPRAGQFNEPWPRRD